jgi:His/Glu/Gln/Arg/opine family amino acid ABC transporter permease subunit
MNYTFHWHQAFEALPAMLAGALVTLETAVLSMVIGVACGIGLALARNSGSRAARGFATAWIETARNTPTPIPTATVTASFAIFLSFASTGHGINRIREAIGVVGQTPVAAQPPCPPVCKAPDGGSPFCGPRMRHY